MNMLNRRQGLAFLMSVFMFVAVVPSLYGQEPVIERRYTVKEIDDLREVCERRYLYGTTSLVVPQMSRAYYENDKIKAVEELLRTYMMAGITAKQINEEDKKTTDTTGAKIISLGGLR